MEEIKNSEFLKRLKSFRSLGKNNKFLRSKFLIIIIFMILSIANNGIFFFGHGWLLGGADLQFHLQRIDEIYQNLRNFNILPYIATYDFNQNGSAVMSMHPKFPLYFYAIIRFIFKSPLTSYSIANSIFTFISLNISYFSYLSVRHNEKLGAYLFSIFYSLSALKISYNFLNADIGVTFTLAILPLVFAGFYHWITDSKYKMLTVGVSLVFLSHILNFIFVVIVLLVLLFINYKQVDGKKLINLGKAVSLTILLTATYWIPALMFGSSTKMIKPFKYDLGGISLISYLQLALTNQVTYGFTITAILGFILGGFWYRKISKLNKQIYWLSLACVFISSTIFPWFIFENTFVSIIQFPWRILIFSELGFNYILCIVIVRLTKNMDTSSVKGLTVLLTTIILILSLNAQNHRIQFEINAPEVNYTLTPSHNINYKNEIAWFKVTNKYEYDLLMQYINTFDYYPAKSAKVVQNVATHMVTPIKHSSVPSNSKKLFSIF